MGVCFLLCFLYNRNRNRILRPVLILFDFFISESNTDSNAFIHGVKLLRISWLYKINFYCTINKCVAIVLSKQINELVIQKIISQYTYLFYVLLRVKARHFSFWTLIQLQRACALAVTSLMVAPLLYCDLTASAHSCSNWVRVHNSTCSRAQFQAQTVAKHNKIMPTRIRLPANVPIACTTCDWYPDYFFA